MTMSNTWHWYVLLGTLISLIAIMWLLFANRTTSGEKTTGHEWDGIEELDNPLPLWWVGLFVGSVIYGLVYLIWYPGLGDLAGIGEWTSTGQLKEITEQHDARFAPLYAELASLDVEAMAEDRRARQVGRRLFLNNCSICHGLNGQGLSGFPNLADDEWIWGRRLDEIKASIRNGRSAAMPAWETVIKDKGVSEVTQYVLSLSGRVHDEDMASRGSNIFSTMCAACHGAQGKGIAALGGPDLSNDIWLYGGDSQNIAESIRKGRNGQMPAQLGKLGEDRITILAGYLVNLSQ